MRVHWGTGAPKHILACQPQPNNMIEAGEVLMIVFPIVELVRGGVVEGFLNRWLLRNAVEREGEVPRVRRQESDSIADDSVAAVATD